MPEIIRLLSGLLYRYRKWLAILLLMMVYYFSLPKHLFEDSYATVLESREGKLLSARIARDMQWRFPPSDSVPNKFKSCILAYEDAYFYKHPGFNPVSIFKALYTNIKAGKILRGGSTLTQQVIRLSRQKKKRTYWEKMIEVILATRLELRYSKDKILSLYASHAPFGGNSVGLEAASWRYFGVSPEQLSWAESATLAVLPNAPGLIHPGRNREALRDKRDRLLKKLYHNKRIDSLTYILAMQEPLPEKVKPLPDLAPHLIEKLARKPKIKRIRSSLSMDLQKQVNELVKQHYLKLKNNRIYNAAVIVVEVPTRRIIAYTGNTEEEGNPHQNEVDIIDRPRSTGSILKPFLYMAMLDAGEILPKSLIPDIPTDISGYQPENYDLQYRGAVPAHIALKQSLNVPAVRMLKNYGLKRFYHQLQKLQLNHISKGAEHYGLSLILGGAESSLYNLTRAYAAMSSTLNHYDITQGKYYDKELTEITPLLSTKTNFGKPSRDYPLFNAGAIYTAMDVMRNLNRPDGAENWEYFEQAKNIAWKTGTSFGFRDAWAIGITPEYAVGVWVGNADGEGRPGLTGHSTAAPLMFDVFNLLPQTSWFSVPYDEMRQLSVCSQSGYIAGEYCTVVDTMYVPASGMLTGKCPYHKPVALDNRGIYRVNMQCENPEKIKTENFFVLPPVQAFYYKKYHPEYRSLPPFKKGCYSDNENVMQFVGGQNFDRIFLPKDFDEKRNALVVKVKHNRPETRLYWYVDGIYKAQTTRIHELSLSLKRGSHELSVVDEYGNEIHKRLLIY